MKVRGFIAVDISREIRNAITRVQSTFQVREPRVNWVEPDNLHLTLKFCGLIDDPDILGIAEVLKQQFQGSGSFPLYCEGVGTFPDMNAKSYVHPRVIWVGAHVNDSFLERVQRLDLELMEQVGLRPESRLFHPHITLGRVKTTRDLDNLKAEIVKHKDTDFGECLVSKVILYESKRSPKGPIYTSLFTVVWLRDQQFIQIYTQFFSVLRIQSMFGIDDCCDTSLFLCTGNHM